MDATPAAAESAAAAPASAANAASPVSDAAATSAAKEAPAADAPASAAPDVALPADLDLPAYLDKEPVSAAEPVSGAAGPHLSQAGVMVHRLSLDYCVDEEMLRQLELDSQEVKPGQDAQEGGNEEEQKEEGQEAADGDEDPSSTEFSQTKTGRRVSAWNLNSGRRKEGTNQLTMILPAITRIALNVVGGTVVAGGYAAGKVGEVVGGGKAVDSSVFQAGFFAWMFANGIFPETKYEPIPDDVREQLSKMYTFNKTFSEKDVNITPIIVSNHVCYLDGIVLAAVFHAPKIVAKDGARSVPAFGKIMEEMDVVFVNRSDADSKKATMDALQKHSDDWSPGAKPLLVFPEGTTANGVDTLPFKKGAFLAGVPVRPVVIVYTGEYDPANTSFIKEKDGTVREMTDQEWAAQIMGHFLHSIHVRVLPPYIPSEAEKADADLFANNVRSYSQANLDRVRQELVAGSWKEAAGREHGGLNYQFGDVARTMYQKSKGMQGWPGLGNILKGALCLGGKPPQNNAAIAAVPQDPEFAPAAAAASPELSLDQARQDQRRGNRPLAGVICCAPKPKNQK